MKGTVQKRQTRNGGRPRWVFILEYGEQPCIRCEGTCDRNARSAKGPRFWQEGTKRLDTCPACGGPVVRGRERRQVWGRGSYRTKGEAERALRTALARGDAGRDPFPETTTVAELCSRWLEHKRSGSGRRARPRTLHRYAELLDRHILPAIGSLPLGAIRVAHIQAALDDMNSRGLAPRTVGHARNVIRGALSFAVAQGLLEVNPVTATEVPTLERPDYATLTADDLMSIIGAAVGSVWEIPALLACTIGTRRSETLGVRWSRIDLDAGTLSVTHGVQRIDGELMFTDVKSHRSHRAIPLPAFTVERLRRWRKVQGERRLALGTEWHDLDLVCERGDGYFLDPDSFTSAFKRIIRRLGLPDNARLHDARHGVGTALAILTGGDATVIRDTLGHARSSFTLDTYVRPTAESSAKAREALDAAFGGQA